ncbi:hypothetical protein RQP46_002528 [Phenoliferia psychrophenolica]
MALASFTTLPPELKARIVEMASNQEAAWRLRVIAPAGRVGHINSLSALALVNKELRSLAAKHQFKSIFRFRILPRYAHHITEIWFLDWHSTEGAEQVLMIAGLLPALRALRFGAQAATSLFGPGVTLRGDLEDEEASHRASIIASFASRIDFLVLYDFKPSEAIGLVRAFSSNLRTLAFLDLKDDSTDRIRDLLRTITSLAALNSLSIDLHADSAGWPSEALPPLEHNPPPIKCLQLFFFPFRDAIFQFVGQFSSTVETLTLELKSPEAISISAIHLPHLINFHLTVQKLDHVNEVTKALLLTRTLTTLDILAPRNGQSGTEDPALLRVLDSQPGLFRLELGASRRCAPFRDFTPSRDLSSPSALSAYSHLVHSRGLDPSVLDQPHLSPFHPKAHLDYTMKEQPFLSQALRRTLEFGMVELERMEAEGSVAKAVGWVPKLKALEDERLAWKD